MGQGRRVVSGRTRGPRGKPSLETTPSSSCVDKETHGQPDRGDGGVGSGCLPLTPCLVP